VISNKEQQTLHQIIISIVSYTRQMPTATIQPWLWIRPNTVADIRYAAK